MNITRKWIVILIIAALLAISACGEGSITTVNVDQSQQENVTLRIAWWGGEPRYNYTLDVIDLYTRANPNVTVEVEYASYDDYWKRLAPQAAASELPDIIQIDTQNYAQYAGRHLLAELTPFFGEEIDISDISENALKGGAYAEGIYGMNLGTNALGFNYDPALLNKAGVSSIFNDWTWDDYEDLAVKAKQAGLYVDTGMRAEVFFGYFLRTKGATLFNEAGTALGYEDDAYFIEHFERLQRLVLNKYAPAPDALAQIKVIDDDFTVKEEAIGIWQWSNQFVALQQIANRPFALAPLPGPNREQGLYLKPSMFFSISENSKVKEEAAKFINFFVNDIEANKLILGERGVPVSGKVKEALKEVLSPAQVQVFDYVAWAEINSSPMDPPDPIGAAEVFSVLTSIVEQINYDQITAAEAAIIFRQEANHILAKNRN